MICGYSSEANVRYSRYSMSDDMLLYFLVFSCVRMRPCNLTPYLNNWLDFTANLNYLLLIYIGEIYGAVYTLTKIIRCYYSIRGSG